VTLLKLQRQNIWLKYIVVVNLVVWLHMVFGPCWCMYAAGQVQNSAAEIHQEGLRNLTRSRDTLARTSIPNLKQRYTSKDLGT